MRFLKRFLSAFSLIMVALSFIAGVVVLSAYYNQPILLLVLVAAVAATIYAWD